MANGIHAETNFYDALYFFEDEEDFEEAQYLLREVLKKEPNNANAKYLLGMCYNKIEGQEHKGIPLLKQATQNIRLKYKSNRYSEKRAPHHAWFYLAEAYRLTNQPDEALDALNNFRGLKDFEKKYNVRITEEAVLAIETMITEYLESIVPPRILARIWNFLGDKTAFKEYVIREVNVFVKES